ncbi:MAG: ABC transporter permease [Planctomycetota bacterium]|jgi:peptide/nickel transport system permease protein|nr:ABC transporter permease [Planctomycetota bacterium]MDP6990223.1 ABC transporter permease [Planctomycetota bacterium]
MTEQAEQSGAAARAESEELEATIYSKDYWDLVFEQLGKRPLFKLGMAVLALLYASAIYAPFLANDRPLVIEAVDLKGYRAAISSLSAVTTGMAGLMKMSEEEYTERLREAGTLGREGVPADRAAALVLEERAAEQRLTVVRRALPAAESDRLGAYEGPVSAALAAFRRGDATAAVEAATEAKTVARGLRRELAAWDPRSPEKPGIRLVGHRRWPLLEALSAKEVFFMVLWGFILAWPAWNPLVNRRLLAGDRERIRRWRRRKALGVGGAALACALLWTASPFHGEAGSFDTAPFKGALATGDMWLVPAGEPISEEMADTLVWTPVAYGAAETHSDAETNFRPPTWSSHARIDGEGRYESGPRKRAADSEDPTGYEVPAVPVEIRPGEPPVNHPLRRIAGTDELGRDFFTRILWGGRVSLMVGILSAALLTTIGVVIGSIAGYFGGWVDIAIMRLIEIIQSLPAFFLILMAMAFTDPKVVPPIVAIVVVIALIRWTGTARLVRGEFLRLREQEFVLASEALGFSDARTIFRHVLPNALSPVLVSAAFAVAAGILTESAISFLGFGTRPPEASWGALVNESKNPEFWWIQVFPGVLIFITVTCYNLVGEAIRDALDPKMKL